MKLLQYLIVGSRSPENDPQLHRYVRMEIKLQNSKRTCRIRMDRRVDHSIHMHSPIFILIVNA